MDKKIYDQILDSIKDRKDWEDEQALWYEMRHQGVRRTAKPYVGAPDMHFPLGDALVDKIKPLYIQQVYSNETIASFVPTVQQQIAETSKMTYWFDYKLKQKSNFEREMYCAIDTMAMSGVGPMKVYWDSDANQLCFDSIDPLNFIVPQSTEEIQDADWLVQVIQMSEAQYRANKTFDQDDEFVKSIKGKGQGRNTTLNEQVKADREGLTYANDRDKIIIWEVYCHDREKNIIYVDTVAPVLGYDTGEVRSRFALPYNKGVFARATYPFGVL